MSSEAEARDAVREVDAMIARYDSRRPLTRWDDLSVRQWERHRAKIIAKAAARAQETSDAG